MITLFIFYITFAFLFLIFLLSVIGLYVFLIILLIKYITNETKKGR